MVFGISGVCLGFADTRPRATAALAAGRGVALGRYHAQGRADRLAAYNGKIRDAGVYKKKDGSLDGWTDVMARTTSQPPPDEGRCQLREILLEQGFEQK